MFYETAEEWQDVVPIPQDEGGPNPLAAIVYTGEYSEAMSYLRAVMADNEASERALRLTEHVIEMNPAHYTVWLFRVYIIKTLQKNPSDELRWLNGVALRRSKNYQIWQHRQTIINLFAELPSSELSFLATALEKDAKNYHVWTYRQWLVQRFKLWPSLQDADQNNSELAFTETLLHEDVYNNSAWNHRYFALFGREKVDEAYSAASDAVADAIWSREVDFVKDKISIAPENVSSWNYLRGLQKKRQHPLDELEGFVERFANPENVTEIRSSHALDLLAEIRAKSKPSSAKRALELLIERFDPIRASYWRWRINALPTAPP